MWFFCCFFLVPLLYPSPPCLHSSSMIDVALNPPSRRHLPCQDFIVTAKNPFRPPPRGRRWLFSLKKQQEGKRKKRTYMKFFAEMKCKKNDLEEKDDAFLCVKLSQSLKEVDRIESLFELDNKTPRIHLVDVFNFETNSLKFLVFSYFFVWADEVLKKISPLWEGRRSCVCVRVWPLSINPQPPQFSQITSEKNNKSSLVFFPKPLVNKPGSDLLWETEMVWLVFNPLDLLLGFVPPRPFRSWQGCWQ